MKLGQTVYIYMGSQQTPEKTKNSSEHEKKDNINL